MITVLIEHGERHTALPVLVVMGDGAEHQVRQGSSINLVLCPGDEVLLRVPTVEEVEAEAEQALGPQGGGAD